MKALETENISTPVVPLSWVLLDTDNHKPTQAGLVCETTDGGYAFLPLTVAEGQQVVFTLRQDDSVAGRKVISFSGTMKIPDGVNFPVFTGGILKYSDNTTESLTEPVRFLLHLGDTVEIMADSLNQKKSIRLMLPD